MCNFINKTRLISNNSKGMYMKYFAIIILFGFLACSKYQDNKPNTIIQEGWSVSEDELVGSLDPFPLIIEPNLSNVSDILSLSDDASVAIVYFNDQVNIYPLSYIHRFEVINDRINDKRFAITFCPITQSVICVNNEEQNSFLSLRASGILYKENLVMYNENSQSFWSQMYLLGIKGAFSNTELKSLSMFETTWLVAKTFFPEAKVFYDERSIHNDKTIPKNERVFGVIENLFSKKVYIYQYSDFLNSTKIYYPESINKFIVVGNAELNYIAAFIINENNAFTPLQNSFPDIMEDSHGNTWNIFGIATKGPNAGDRLKTPFNYLASWWAWKSFYKQFEFIEYHQIKKGYQMVALFKIKLIKY
ncbi:MAG TPA: DUF3179 domain-containing protein [Lutibacter sp.]|nr:DUF3179 domain-containing protein [Lutibacter sp.]